MSRENIDFLFYVCWPHYDVQTKLKNIEIQFSISIFFSPKENWHSPMWIACCKCKHITVPNLGFVSILLGIWLYFWSKSFVHKCIHTPLFLFGRQQHTFTVMELSVQSLNTQTLVMARPNVIHSRSILDYRWGNSGTLFSQLPTFDLPVIGCLFF